MPSVIDFFTFFSPARGGPFGVAGAVLRRNKIFIVGDAMELHNKNADVRPLADALCAYAGNPKP